MQLVEEGLNASKPGDTTAAAAALITEMAALEQVRTLLHPYTFVVVVSHLVPAVLVQQTLVLEFCPHCTTFAFFSMTLLYKDRWQNPD